MPDRIQREIEEILSHLEESPPKRPLRSRLRRGVTAKLRGVGSSLRSLPRPRLSLGQLMLLGIALIIIAWVANPSAVVYRLIIGAGVVLLILAFVLSFRRTSRPPEKRWRGQPMELHESGMGSRLRSWWERWRSRR